jgi:hypothetical protein
MPNRRQIKKQGPFDQELLSIVPDPFVRYEIEKFLVETVGAHPEEGLLAGMAAPSPIYYWPLARTAVSPGLVVFYTFSEKILLLMSARQAEPDDE